MGEGLKKTGKIALYIITPTVILVLVLIFIWAYKKYKKKKADAIIIDKESTLSDATKNEHIGKAHIEIIERKSGVVKEEIKKEEPVKVKDDDSKVIDDVKEEDEKDTKK